MDLGRVLQNEIIETLVLLQTLNLTNLSLLGQFFQKALTDTQLFRSLEGIVRTATPSQLEALIIAATSGGGSGGKGRNQGLQGTEDDIMSLVMSSLQESQGVSATSPITTTTTTSQFDQQHNYLGLSGEDQFISQFSEVQLEAITVVYKVQQLQSMLAKSFSVNQLMKLFEIVPTSSSVSLAISTSSTAGGTSSPETQQLQFLEQLQQLFANTLPETLLSVQEQLSFAPFGEEQEQLAELMQLPWDQFHLCKPLKLLLQMDHEELVTFHEALPKLQPLQLVQLVQLLQADPYTVLEFRRILSSASIHSSEYGEYQELPSQQLLNVNASRQMISSAPSASFEIATIKTTEDQYVFPTSLPLSFYPPVILPVFQPFYLSVFLTFPLSVLFLFSSFVFSSLVDKKVLYSLLLESLSSNNLRRSLSTDVISNQTPQSSLLVMNLR
jgi:hypothetical protein